MFGTNKKLPEITAIEVQRDAMNRLASSEQALRSQHTAALHAKNAIAITPAPKTEQVAAMRRLVDELAARFTAEHGFSLTRRLSGSLEMQPDGTYREIHPEIAGWSPRGFNDELRFNEICGLIPEPVKAGLEQIIRSHPAAANELSSTKRLAAMAEAEIYIRQIEDTHARFVDEAGALTPPIVIAHLQPVRARREQEAVIRQREERARELRAPLEQAVNSRPRQPSSLINGPSTSFPEGRPEKL